MIGLTSRQYTTSGSPVGAVVLPSSASPLDSALSSSPSSALPLSLAPPSLLSLAEHAARTTNIQPRVIVLARCIDHTLRASALPYGRVNDLHRLSTFEPLRCAAPWTTVKGGWAWSRPPAEVLCPIKIATSMLPRTSTRVRFPPTLEGMAAGCDRLLAFALTSICVAGC